MAVADNLAGVTPVGERVIAPVFNVTEARTIVRHLFRREPRLYWLDLLSTMTVVYVAGYGYLAPGLSWRQALAGLLCACAVFRVGMFIHEIQHMRRGEMRGFKIGWNLLFGVPFLLPSFMYANHRDHHDRRTYGTARDGEYSSFATGPLAHIAGHFLVALVAPLAGLVRFLILGPLSLLHPPLRRWVLRHATTLGDPATPRRVWPDEPRALWAGLELLACATIVGYLTLLTTGKVPWTVVPKAYALGVVAVTLNAMRDFTAHRFGRIHQPMSHAEQLADSINIVGGGPATALIYPIGMRFHALHHLFPPLPYHNLAAAHRLLMERLPEESPYRTTNRGGFLEVARDLVGRAWAHSRRVGEAR